MKVAVMIIGLIGSLFTIGLGAKWLSDFHKYKETFAQIEKMSSEMPAGQGMPKDLMGQVKKTHIAAYAMVGLGVLSLLASFLGFKMGKVKVGGAIMFVTVLVPAVMAPQSLVATFPLIVSGVLAMMMKPSMRI